MRIKLQICLCREVETLTDCRLTLKCRQGCFVSNEWQRIFSCRTKVQLFILTIRGGKGRSSIVLLTSNEYIWLIQSRWCCTISKCMISSASNPSFKVTLELCSLKEFCSFWFKVVLIMLTFKDIYFIYLFKSFLKSHFLNPKVIL